MELVIDANPLFAALIKGSFTASIIASYGVRLFAPEFLFEEFLEHKEEILGKAKRSEEEFRELFSILTKLIKTIPSKEIGPFLEEARQISPDEDDVPYLALAIKLNAPIWSNDKRLKRQDRVKVYSTEDLKDELGG
ncbi:hypothetical protein HYV84_01090 [Candidatus Woesearchaeota archaeon]|nr:hypothetical protein [Candidatus Woesearchaeota archaeon]